MVVLVAAKNYKTLSIPQFKMLIQTYIAKNKDAINVAKNNGNSKASEQNGVQALIRKLSHQKFKQSCI